jgi:hypothetical protein
VLDPLVGGVLLSGRSTVIGVGVPCPLLGVTLKAGGESARGEEAKLETDICGEFSEAIVLHKVQNIAD